ncbi:hypothetical protein HMPREF9135_0034 [Segatella baroniae F0067]|uniref:Uncharacterized protein n=1 Tax=Segatella baroniae F0067 TaxID=1115809 RepID=U2QMH7_9BACT|nr:hypothetical protein HMPREF9135_0034 [Segatella baroniae F0067]
MEDVPVTRGAPMAPLITTKRRGKARPHYADSSAEDGETSKIMREFGAFIQLFGGQTGE